MESNPRNKKITLSEEETKNDSYPYSEDNQRQMKQNGSISVRERKATFSKTQKAILEEWIKTHEEFTYPNADNLQDLIEITGLTDKQIRVWFTNHRNRKQSRAEICLSRIKYSIQSKSFQRRSKRFRDKHVKETSNYFLSKYFCICGMNFDKISDDESESRRMNTSKYLKA